MFAGLSLLWAILWFCSTRATGMTDRAALAPPAKGTTETKATDGIFEHPLRKAEVWGSCLAWGCNGYVFYFFLFWLPTYFVRARGMSVGEMAGFATIPWLVLFIAMNFAGWAVDVIKRRSRHSIFWRRMVYAGAFVWAAVFIYPLQNVQTSREAVVLICVAFLGLGWTWPVASVLPIEYSPPKAGVITGFMQAWNQIAGIIAPLITGAVIAGGNWGGAFLVAAAMALLGALLVTVPSRYSTGVGDPRKLPVGSPGVTTPPPSLKGRGL
jgi:ACS family glucarate transporter-like MFS transporter